MENLIYTIKMGEQFIFTDYGKFYPINNNKYRQMNRIKIIVSLMACIFFTASLSAQVEFDEYFKDKTLRVDFQLGGDAENTEVFFQQMKQEPHYADPRKNLVSKFNYGAYRYSLYDIKSGKLIFSKGFCSLYNEWIATEEAKKVKRCFYHTATMPFPKNKVRFVIELRQFKNGKFKKIFDYQINPRDYFISREEPKGCNVSKVLYSGEPAKCLDIAFIAEGYTKEEMPKFRKDVKRMIDYMLGLKAYKPYVDYINVWAVESPSVDSGTDIPGHKIYKNTAVNSTFYTFDIERYLTTVDIKSISDAAANAPHDAVYVLVNTSKYGGGGFYNFYGLSSADNPFAEKVVAHEFGHSFAGLADEYYTSAVATEEYYNLKVEPWEPNITTNKDFGSKWKDMIENDTPVPTPRTEAYDGVVGMFEGGGYMAKGIYSPAQDCVMKSNTLKEFCPVCERAIRRMIEFYLDK